MGLRGPYDDPNQLDPNGLANVLIVIGSILQYKYIFEGLSAGILVQ